DPVLIVVRIRTAVLVLEAVSVLGLIRALVPAILHAVAIQVAPERGVAKGEVEADARRGERRVSGERDRSSPRGEKAEIAGEKRCAARGYHPLGRRDRRARLSRGRAGLELFRQGVERKCFGTECQEMFPRDDVKRKTERTAQLRPHARTSELS